MRKIDKRDWQTYWSFYQTILGAIRPPDLMIYLHCPIRTLRQRIRIRGRPMEQDISLSYLKRLQSLYEKWIENYSLGEILVLDSGKLDFAGDLVDRQDVRARVEALLPSALKRSTR
jgi:deoxyadenosine/deoxycytidine kinase